MMFTIVIDGGYISFSADAMNDFHYYIQDYMGNNRMVVNGRTDSIEQVTHYYPYGGVIGDISMNESLQKFKFEGKELDRTFGLDNYDIHARQYFAMAPMWDRVDPLAEKYYGISPYVYCGGDPVNRGDYDGRVWTVTVPLCAIGGALLGAVGSGVGNAVEQSISNGKVEMEEVGKAAITGSVVSVVATTGAYAFKRFTSKLTEIPDRKMQVAINEAVNSLTSQQKRGVIIGSNTSKIKLSKAQILNKAKAEVTKNLEEDSKTLGAEIKSLGYIDPGANVLSYKLQDWLKNE